MKFYDWFMVTGLVALVLLATEEQREAYMLLSFALVGIAGIHELFDEEK